MYIDKTYYDVPWQVDAVCHGADFFKGVEHGPVRAAHRPPVLVLGVTEFIKTSRACSLWWKQRVLISALVFRKKT